jgi:hypothetical protein
MRRNANRCPQRTKLFIVCVTLATSITLKPIVAPAQQRDAQSIAGIQPAPKTQQEPPDEKAKELDQSFANWWMVRLTAVIATIGFIQIFVFGLQARRLRETIEKMGEIAEGQTVDMKASVAEAVRTATAMEGVAASTMRNIETSKDAIRAWVIATKATFSPTRGIDIEFKNVGQTPATKLGIAVAVAYHDRPGLPEDIPDPINNSASSGTLGKDQPGTRNIDFTKFYKQGKGKFLYVYGRLKYCDVFDEWISVRFCFCQKAEVIHSAEQITPFLTGPTRNHIEREKR